MSKLLIKKEDIGDCKQCKVSPVGVKFSGRLNIRNYGCSHFTSTDGWWLRLEHRRDSILPNEADQDFVSQLLCPKCNKEHGDMLSTILEL